MCTLCWWWFANEADFGVLIKREVEDWVLKEGGCERERRRARSRCVC